jgi:hypothetical protein
MMAKNEHITALAGLVDTVVGAAGAAVDEARKTLDVVDEYVTKGAVVLTRVVDVLEGVNNAPVDENTQNTSDYFANWLAKYKGFNLDYLRSLDLNAIMDLYNSTVAKGDGKAKSWSEFTDDVTKATKVDAEAPVEEESLDRDYYIDYLLSKPSNPYSRRYLSMLRDDEVLLLYRYCGNIYHD